MMGDHLFDEISKSAMATANAKSKSHALFYETSPIRTRSRRAERHIADREGRTIWIVDSHRDDGKRFVVRADEKLTAFLELETAIQAAEN